MERLPLNTRIPASKWASLKDIIYNLYMELDLKLESSASTMGLINMMAGLHNFHPTKSQYERQFKKWDFRKYRTNPQDEWKAVAYLIEKRRAAGKSSVVYIDGKCQSKKKISKEISRYTTTSNPLNYYPASPRLLAQIRVATPLQNYDTSIGQVQISSYDGSIEREGRSLMNIEHLNLPSFQFEAFLQTNLSSTLSKLEILMSRLSLDFGNPLDLQSGQHLTSEIPSYGRYTGGYISTDNAITSGTQNSRDYTSEMISPSSFLSDPASGVLSHGGQGILSILKLTIFVITNNLDDDRKLLKKLCDLFTGPDELRALNYMLSSKGPASDALADKLFGVAVENENLALVELLLERGLHPDDFTIGPVGFETRPLLFACDQQNLALVQHFLKAGADPSQCSNTGLNCLYYAISGSLVGHSGVDGWNYVATLARDNKLPPAVVNMELVQVLLEAGVDVNVPNGSSWSPLCGAVCRSNVALVTCLLDAGADVNWIGASTVYKTEFTSLLCSAKIPYPFYPQEALKITKALMDSGADPNAGVYYCRTPGHERQEYPIELAAEEGCFEIFQLLHASGAAITSQTVASACASGNLTLVQYLMSVYNDGLLHPTGLELPNAIESGNLEVVQLLLNNNLLPQTINQYRDALEAAACTGNRKLLERLLASCPLDYEKYEERSAAERSNPIPNITKTILTHSDDVVQLLLDSGALVEPEAVAATIEQGNRVLTEKFTSIWRVPQHGEYRIREGCKPLVAAIRKQDYSLILGILQNYEIYREKREVAVEIAGGLMEAIEIGDLNIVQMLMDSGANLSVRTEAERNLAFSCAAVNADLDLIKLLLNSGEESNYSEILFAAVLNDNVALVQELLLWYKGGYEGRRRSYGCSALSRAIVQQNSLLVEILLSHGIDPNMLGHPRCCKGFREACSGNLERKESALGVAIRIVTSKSFDIISKLLDAGAKPNDVVSVQWRGEDLPYCETALVAAIRSKEAPIVKLLISRGAEIDPPATARVMRTPLQAACKCGSVEIVQLLLELGVNVNSPPATRGGATALQFAAIGGQVGIASLLLDAGADVNAAPARLNGRTALEGSAEWGRLDMVQMLLNAGACIEGPGDRQYKAAMMLATRNKHHVVRKLLESAMLRKS